jgi:hypothetical protein
MPRRGRTWITDGLPPLDVLRVDPGEMHAHDLVQHRVTLP